MAFRKQQELTRKPAKTSFELMAHDPFSKQRPPPNGWMVALRLTIGFFACTLASSLFSGWPTIAALMVENNVLDEGCDGFAPGNCPAQNERLQNLYMISSSCSVAAMTLVGQLYDCYGPKAVGVGGALGVMIGTFMVFIALGQQMGLWVFCVAFTLINVTGFINSFGLLGFAFHVTKYQTFVFGIMNGSNFCEREIRGVILWFFYRLFRSRSRSACDLFDGLSGRTRLRDVHTCVAAAGGRRLALCCRMRNRDSRSGGEVVEVLAQIEEEFYTGIL
jgi:hypothetical protein